VVLATRLGASCAGTSLLNPWHAESLAPRGRVGTGGTRSASASSCWACPAAPRSRRPSRPPVSSGIVAAARPGGDPRREVGAGSAELLDQRSVATATASGEVSRPGHDRDDDAAGHRQGRTAFLIWGLRDTPSRKLAEALRVPPSSHRPRGAGIKHARVSAGTSLHRTLPIVWPGHTGPSWVRQPVPRWTLIGRSAAWLCSRRRRQAARTGDPIASSGPVGRRRAAEVADATAAEAAETTTGVLSEHVGRLPAALDGSSAGAARPRTCWCDRGR